MSRTVEQRESMYILEQYFQYTYTRASVRYSDFQEHIWVEEEQDDGCVG